VETFGKLKILKMTTISTDIQKAVSILEQEELVAIPTETVYGLAGNIFSEKALKKIFELKKRPFFNPLIVHIYSFSQLDELVSFIPPKAKLLAEAFWPGSLTLILKKKPIVSDLVTSGKDSVGVRMPNHPITLSLLKKLSFPLAAPSANPFTCISPTKAEHVEAYFGSQLKMILDGGNCKNGIESTIVGFVDDEPVIYRLGAISSEEIEKVVGKITVKNKKEDAPDAPGMLLKHYSPLTKTYLETNVEERIKEFPDKKIGLLLFSKKLQNPQIANQEILSESEDFKEATANLYSALHKLDQLNLDVIIAERLPDIDLGRSINDRLERAANK
jgi:L-threonylcarbamoyladenylate synthase